MNTRAVVRNTPHTTSLHQYLDTTCHWNIIELKKVITQNPSSINEVRSMTETPLIKALQSKKCTVHIIKLLLHHGADVNFNKGLSPLMVALVYCRDDKVIALLLDNGARVDVLENGFSPLCFAFQHRVSRHVIKLLLNAGSSVHTCRRHSSILHCFCNCWEKREDILKLLIEAGTEVSKLDADGRSPMCHALSLYPVESDIELLTRAGIHLNACRKHPSPFGCLVHNSSKYRKFFKTDMLKALLGAGAHFDMENDSTMLHNILLNHVYENEAIRLLLDVSGIDVNGLGQLGETLLHCAVRNPFCLLSVLEFLLDKGAKVGKLDAKGETALSVAIQSNRPLEVIKLLLKKGSPINTQDHNTSRPLMIAVKHGIHFEVVMTLLIAGARIGMQINSIRKGLYDCAMFWGNYPRVNCKIDVFKERTLEGVNCIKCLIKCYVLEGSEFHIEDLTSHRGFDFNDIRIRDMLQGFPQECKLELRQMESENVGHGRTLHQLISRKSPPRTISAGCMTEGKDFDFNRLLEALSGNAFPLYFDIISANVGKESMEKKLQEVSVYTVINCPDSLRTNRKVTLIYDIVRVIAGHLSDEELLRLILAFDKPMNHAGRKRGNEEQKVVGPGPSNFQKRSKLD